jgi:hypothetical protein
MLFAVECVHIFLSSSVVSFLCSFGCEAILQYAFFRGVCGGLI